MSHARLAPSKSSRVLLCAASANREAALPDEEAGPAANEGSNVHWLGEHGLNDRQWPPKIIALGMPMVQASAPYPEIDITPDNLEAAQRYYEYVTRRLTELPGATLLIEEKVDPQLYTGRDDSDGSCDAGIVASNFLEVVDLKNGGVQVEPECSQLRLYALGMMAKYADQLSGLTPFETIRLTVFQPKRPGMDTIERSIDFTQAELIDWAVDVWAPAAIASDNPDAKATVTDDGCKYCKCAKQSKCPEYTAAMQGSAAMLFQPVEGQAIAVIDPLASEFRVEAMSPEQLGLFLEIWPLMKARGKDIEEQAVKLMKARTTIPGFKLVKGKGSRGWLLPDDEQDAKFKNMKLTLKQRFKETLRSPAQMLSLELTTAKKEAIKKHIVHKDGALTLAPVSDKRVDIMPAVEFNPVETQAEVAPAAVVPDFLSL